MGASVVEHTRFENLHQSSREREYTSYFVLDESMFRLKRQDERSQSERDR